MAPPRITFDPEKVAEAKRLYEQTLLPVQVIAAGLKISRDTLVKRINEWGWNKRSGGRGGGGFEYSARALTVAELTQALPDDVTARRLAVAARIQGAVEREMDAVERVLDKLGPADGAEAERSARTLASLARTMHEIAALARPDDVTPPDEADDDAIPCDIDALRNELARRIHAIIDARQAGANGGGQRADREHDAARG